MVGSGREEARLQEQAARDGIGDAVFFLGARRDVAELYRAMDVFALSSLWEGGPITLIEAMASGLPVVATPVGIVPEVVRDGVNGFLVPLRIRPCSRKLSGGCVKIPPWRRRLDGKAGSRCGIGTPTATSPKR